MSTKRAFTKNPLRPARYRAGKPGVEQRSSSGEESDDEQSVAAARHDTTRADSSGKVALRPAPISQQEAQARRRAEYAENARLEKEAGFVTESENESDDDDELADPITSQTLAALQHPEHVSESETSEEESEDSSEDDRPRMVRPIFVRKEQHVATHSQHDGNTEEEERRRKADADSMIQTAIEQRQAEQEASRKNYDDDMPQEDEDAIDDTDGLDEELEYQQWVARELARLKRTRAQLEQRETELAEVERRQRLTSAERDAEDRHFLEQQRQGKQDREKINHMQKYHHKGAFYQEEAEEMGLRSRDLMSAAYADQSKNLDALPEYLQVRDVTRIGRKGRTRYRDMQTEDTGRFGEDRGRGLRFGGLGGDDDRFRPDRRGAGADVDGPTGANASAVGDKRRVEAASEMVSKRPRFDTQV